MGMETVTNYTCDRCGRSEIADKVTILTLSVRARAGKHVPGQGKSLVSAHICQENCLKMIKAAMVKVNKPGQYDRKAAAERRRAATATNGGTKPTNNTKGGTKKARTARTSKIKGTSVPAPQATPENATETRADVVKAVRRITRTSTGGWAKGHNYRTERAMIAERESISSGK